MAQSKTIVDETIISSVEEAKDSLALYRTQAEAHALEVKELQEHMESSHLKLRAEVGEQISACRDAVLSRVELATRTVQACEQQANEHQALMSSQCESGLDSCSSEANRLAGDLERKLRELEIDRREAQEKASQEKKSVENRIANEVSNASHEMDSAIAECRELVEAQKSALEGFGAESILTLGLTPNLNPSCFGRLRC